MLIRTEADQAHHDTLVAQEARYYAFLAADQEWSRQLQERYGKRAGDMRYVPGEGDTLSGYAEFRRTGDAWRAGLPEAIHPCRG